MNGKERLLAAMGGEKTERPPLALWEGFEYWKDISGADAFGYGWMAEPEYRRIIDAARHYGTAFICQCHVPAFNRFMMTEQSRISTREEYLPDGKAYDVYGSIKTTGGELSFKNRWVKHRATEWHIEFPVKELSDMEALMRTPFEPDAKWIRACTDGIEALREKLDEDTLFQFFLPTPVVTISRCMPFELFLESSILERELFKTVLEEITRRHLAVLDVLLPGLSKDMVFWIGGSEQCTPPMMAPEAYRELVKPYDSRIVERLKRGGYIVGCHCHGYVADALGVMCDIGFDATDPVEPPDQGNVTLREAFRVTEGKMTLLGNLEFSDLENASKSDIALRTGEMAECRGERLILAASGGPVSPVTAKLADNYLAWFREYDRLF